MSASLDAHNWYTIRDRKKVGPLPWSELCRLAAAGLLKPTDMVLCEGQTRWSEAGSLPGLFPAPVAALAPEGESAPTLAPPMLPSATMLSARVDDTHKVAFVAPIQLPGYELLEELGRGGMGVVYKARQQKASRVVALKMILSGAHAGKEDLTRFQTEAEAVARLQHPHIVQVYEIGEHEGRPFFSLEYCGGGTLDRKLRDNPLLPKDAARLVEVLARAMHHAHTHHILHRDLKPANVLLTEDGVPKITDFGLAKKLDEAGQTASGAVMGTPSYMSPEQASGKGKHLTPSTDVYALGALLYDCLAGRPPFRAATALDTILQVITDAPVPPAHLNAKVPADLQTICLTCLEKNPVHRYATAEALAEDLRRFTSGEPIQARPAGLLERSWKWAKRRPASAALIGVVALALLVVVLGAIAFSVRVGNERNAALDAAALAERQRQRAEENEKKAEVNEQTANDLKVAAEKREVFVRDELDKARRSLLTAQIGRASGLWRTDPLQALQLLQDRNACPAELRDFAWGYYHGLCLSWKPASLIPTPAASIHWIAASADGKRTAVALSDGTVKVIDVEENKLLLTLRGHQGAVDSVAFNRDGTLLATGGDDRSVRLWNALDGKEIVSLTGHSGPISAVSFSPDGRWLASGSGVMYNNYPNSDQRHRDGEVRLWDVAEKKLDKVLLPKQEAAIRCVAFSPDSQTVAACTTHQGSVKLLDAATGNLVNQLRGQAGWVYRVVFSPDGQRVAWATAQQVIYIARLKASKPQQTLRGHQDDIHGLAWSPDGQTIATGDGSGHIKLWDPLDERERFTVRLDGSAAVAMTFTPDGRSLLTGHSSGRATVWQLTPNPEVLSMRGQGYPAVAVDGGTAARPAITLAALTNDKALLLRDLATGRERRPDFTGGVGISLALAPDGKLLALGTRVPGMNHNGTNGELQLWEVGADRRVATLKASSGLAPTALRFLDDGRSLIVGWIDGKVTIWDVPEQKQTAELGQLAGRVRSLAVSPDGKLLAAAGGAEIKLWELTERRERTWRTAHPGGVTGLAFLDGGKTLVSVGMDRAVLLWGVAEGKVKRRLPHQLDAMLGLAVSPDGQTLALGCGDRTVRLLDVVSGQQRASLGGFTKEVPALAFSADSRYLVAGSAAVDAGWWVKGGELKVWKSDVSPKH